MKIYKLDIDTTQPIRQALKVPVSETKYGIAVSVTKGDHTIRNLSCSMDIDGQTVEPTKRLDDGSFLFELQSSDGDYVAKVHAAAEPTYFEGQTLTNTSPRIQQKAATVFTLEKGEYYSDELNPLGFRQAPVASAGYTIVIYSETSAIVNAQRMTYNIADPTKTLQLVLTSPEVVIYPLGTNLVISSDTASYSLSISVPAKSSVTTEASYVGYHVDTYIDVDLKSSKDAQADLIIDDPVDFTNVDATNLSADNFTLSGVSYIPTTLSVDGVAYTVLAAVSNTENT